MAICGLQSRDALPRGVRYCSDMLDSNQISDIAGQVVRTKLSKAHLERIVTESATDSDGNEALRITLVFKPEAAKKLTGDNALDLLVGIQQKLQAEGEERFPIVEYATEQELLSGDDQEQADEHQDDA
jgi:hypothetical protein